MEPSKPNTNVDKYIETKIKNNDRIKFLMEIPQNNQLKKTNILEYKSKKPTIFNKIIKKI